MLRFALVALATCAADLGNAQSFPSYPPAGTMKCSDFIHNVDGSWSPREPIELPCSLVISAGADLPSGWPLCGVDLAAILDQACH